MSNNLKLAHRRNTQEFSYLSLKKVIQMSKFSKSLLVLFGLGLFASASTAQDVTSDILENAQDYSDRWVTYGKNYGAWRYMPDSQINRDTIANLRPVRIKQNGVTGGAYEVPP